MAKFYGKYRAKVEQNVDPKQLGRLLVRVPKVMGSSDWAHPAMPFAGVQAGVFVLPPNKANVWVEFEEGDPEKPIWSGGFWDEKTPMPKAAVTPTGVGHILLQTTSGNVVHICDGPSSPMTSAGILIKSGNSTVTIGPDGIKISASKIEITGTLNVNNGALTVSQ